MDYRYYLTIIDAQGREVMSIGKFKDEAELQEWAKTSKGTLREAEQDAQW
jgi:hypothetical protein